jgi:TPR repeat protein
MGKTAAAIVLLTSSVVVVTRPASAADAAAAYDASSLDDCTAKCDARVGAACNEAGVYYKTGKAATPIDEARAATFYQRACDLKNAWGCTNLGTLYKLGRGVTQDFARAAALHKQACDLKNGQGCADLGLLYSEGRGVSKDEARAVALYEQACNGGSAYGCRALGWHVAAGNAVAQDPVRAAALFQQACDGGDATGCGALGDALVRGLGVPVDRAKGITYLHKSCDTGSTFGCQKLRQFGEAQPAGAQVVATAPAGVVVRPPVAPRAAVKVSLETENPQVTLEHVLSESTSMQQVGKYTVAVPVVATSTVCGVPCNASVDSNWRFRVAGSGVAPSSSFMLGAKDGDSLSLKVRPGSHGAQVAGVWLTATGIVFAIVGAVVLPLGAAQHKPAAEGVGGGSLGIGAATLIPGILLLASSSTRVTTDSGRSLAAYPATVAPSNALFSF